MKSLRKISTGISNSFTIWSKELKRACGDIGVFLFFVVVPVVYPILYGIIYNTEGIHEVPLIVVDESHSSLARTFVRKIDATADVQVYAYATSMEEARAAIDNKEAYGILRIPADFSWKINRGEQATVALYEDMSGLLFYKAVLLATTEASLDGLVACDASPVHYEAVAQYNPKSGFASFLLPAILILVIQQTLLLGISMLATTTREKNQGRLIPPEICYSGTFRIVFGKALAYLTVYIPMTIWALIIVPYIFQLPQSAHYATILLFALPYLLACIAFAMLISTFIRGRETPMMILVFTSLIFLFISGISWPQSAIPAFWKYLGYALPSTFGIQGFVKINSMEATLNEVTFEYRMLWLQAGIYWLATCLIYGWNLGRNKLSNESTIT
ncbi:MAG: ABC transporter permease [Dysgonamonadaceae bacterium]|nr:ABC transporter permease [Dysgonamonadaceae bacterium]